MPNIAKVLKDEISRIARKEAKQIVAPFRKPTVGFRHTCADLKRRIVALEISTRQLGAVLAKTAQSVQQQAPAEEKGWISGKGVRSLRQKLGLTQEAFAQLVKVSPNAVYQWERKPGMLRLRYKTRSAVLAARHLGAREAKAQLAEVKPGKKAKPAGKRGRRQIRK